MLPTKFLFTLSKRYHFIYVLLVHKKNFLKNTEVLQLVSYYELEQDCQILEFQNYNVV